MNRNDLRRVDMNLLVIFETLMFENNLTRAGGKLFLGPPSVLHWRGCVICSTIRCWCSTGGCWSQPRGPW